MNLIDLTILAVALGIDCLVVSFSQGLIFKSNRTRNSLILALTMGLFQGVMPCISYSATDLVSKYIEPYAHFIVFAIFMFLGLKFIIEALFFEEKEQINCISLKCLISLGIATSIDALGAGVSLNLTKTPILLSFLIIGFMSFVMSLAGFWSGNFFKHLPSKFLAIAGGIILIFLAVKGVV